ncbi:MAG TPA: hypothetical protein PKL17_21085 [Pseudomonadota bacterium]|nr:hypothetical protein [Pseudomonadota bacterium]
MRRSGCHAVLGLWLVGLPTVSLAAPPVLPSTQPQSPPALPPRPGQPLPNVVPLPNLPPSPTGDSGLSGETDVTVIAPPSPTVQNVMPILTTERRRRFNLLIAGVSTLLAAYTADRLLARDLSQSPVSWVPLVGPWWILNEETLRPNPSSGLQALLVVDGIVQLSGLALTFVGTFLRYDRVVLRLPSPSETSLIPAPPLAPPAPADTTR